MKTVETGRVEVPYSIWEWIMYEGTGVEHVRYEWTMEGGAESDEWFDSVEAARKDVMNYFG